MNLIQEPIFTSDPSGILLKHLTVRPVGRHEREAAQRLFDDEHYLGAVRPVGRTVMQVIEYQGHWVALLDLGARGAEAG